MGPIWKLLPIPESLSVELFTVNLGQIYFLPSIRKDILAQVLFAALKFKIDVLIQQALSCDTLLCFLVLISDSTGTIYLVCNKISSIPFCLVLTVANSRTAFFSVTSYFPFAAEPFPSSRLSTWHSPSYLIRPLCLTSSPTITRL